MSLRDVRPFMGAGLLAVAFVAIAIEGFGWPVIAAATY